MAKKSIVINYVFNVINQLVHIIIPGLIIIYVSRTLGLERLGQYSFASSLITYFMIFACLDFSTVSLRKMAKAQHDVRQQSVIFLEICLCRLIPVGLSLIANLMLVFTGVYGQYTTIMLIFCLDIVSVAFDVRFFFYGNEEFGRIVLINIVTKILSAIGIFTFVHQPSDLWIYVLLNSLVVFTSASSTILLLRKRLVKVKLRELRPLRHLKEAFVLFIPFLALTTYVSIDNVLIGVILKSNAANAFYTQGEKIVRRIIGVIICFNTVMMPHNTREIERGHIEQSKENNYWAFHVVWLLGIPITCGTVLIASNLIPWLLGPGFSETILVMQVFASIILLVSISNVVAVQFLQPRHKDKQCAISSFLGAGVNLAVTIPLVYYFGIIGTAVATIITELAVSTYLLLNVRKELSYKRIFKTALKPLVASLVMTAAIWPLCANLSSSPFHTFLIIGCGVLVYGIAILILRDQLVMKYLHKLKIKFSAKAKVQPMETEIVAESNDQTESPELVDDVSEEPVIEPIQSGLQ